MSSFVDVFWQSGDPPALDDSPGGRRIGFDPMTENDNFNREEASFRTALSRPGFESGSVTFSYPYVAARAYVAVAIGSLYVLSAEITSSTLTEVLGIRDVDLSVLPFNALYDLRVDLLAAGDTGVVILSHVASVRSTVWMTEDRRGYLSLFGSALVRGEGVPPDGAYAELLGATVILTREAQGW